MWRRSGGAKSSGRDALRSNEPAPDAAIRNRDILPEGSICKREAPYWVQLLRVAHGRLDRSFLRAGSLAPAALPGEDRLLAEPVKLQLRGLPPRDRMRAMRITPWRVSRENEQIGNRRSETCHE